MISLVFNGSSAASRDSSGMSTAPVVLIGRPSSLRSAVACQLRTATSLVSCLDSPARLAPAPSSEAPSSEAPSSAGNGLAVAAVVVVTVPRLPGLPSRLRHRFGSSGLAAGFEHAVATARGLGATRLVVVSSAFRYDDDGGLPLRASSPILTAPETAPAAAAERAASLFTRLGGDSVVLRLGWTYGGAEAITRRVMSAAGRGWRLIDGDPAARIAALAEPDAARAVLAALTAAPGTYNVTDGAPATQAMLNARLAAAASRRLHPLYDADWGPAGALFGVSREITDAAFTEMTGWHPRAAPASEGLAGLLSQGQPGR